MQEIRELFRDTTDEIFQRTSNDGKVDMYGKQKFSKRKLLRSAEKPHKAA
jgi:hypothetical protein